MALRPTRRDLLMASSAGIAAAVSTPASAQNPPSAGTAPSAIAVYATVGSQRYSQEPSLAWKAQPAAGRQTITVDEKKTFQEILGFGGALTDAACYTINRMPEDAKNQILQELFAPSEMNLNSCRIAIGSSDYATEAFNYCETGPGLSGFSIDHDRAYVIPLLKRVRKINPGLHLLASPWSPPGWMKAGGTMLGGSMRKSFFEPYASYFVKFVQAYREAGIPVNAVTVQNEVDTDQDGKMPACLWGQEYETGFISKYLGPAFASNQIGAKIWIIDHNYNLWGRAISELDEPDVNKYVDGVAWHGYLGEASAMTRVHAAHPEKHMYWTEGGPDYRDPKYQTNWTQWSRDFTGILRNWARTIITWNIALDEKGKPNIGPFDCGGMLTVHSSTNEVTRSGMYWALAHYARHIRRGAVRLESNGGDTGVTHVCFRNPDRSYVAVLTNTGEHDAAVTLRFGGHSVDVSLPQDAVTTLTWKA